MLQTLLFKRNIDLTIALLQVIAFKEFLPLLSIHQILKLHNNAKVEHFVKKVQKIQMEEVSV